MPRQRPRWRRHRRRRAAQQQPRRRHRAGLRRGVAACASKGASNVPPRGAALAKARARSACRSPSVTLESPTGQAAAAPAPPWCREGPQHARRRVAPLSCRAAPRSRWLVRIARASRHRPSALQADGAKHPQPRRQHGAGPQHGATARASAVAPLSRRRVVPHGAAARASMGSSAYFVVPPRGAALAKARAESTRDPPSVNPRRSMRSVGCAVACRCRRRPAR